MVFKEYYILDRDDSCVVYNRCRFNKSTTICYTRKGPWWVSQHCTTSCDRLHRRYVYGLIGHGKAPGTFHLHVSVERHNITIIQSPSAGATSAHNPFLLTDQQEKQALEKHRQNKARLRVPRRPPWTRDMTHHQLERQERDAFLEWRRGLAQSVFQASHCISTLIRFS